MIAGVDGCRTGWIAVLDDESGRRHVELFESFGDLLKSNARLIVVDVPIGIMDAEPRLADAAARRLLGSRACCVFSAPHRPMLAARSHPEACTIREQIDGKRCSRQAYEIFRKIAEVDAHMTPELQARVAEGHPEVSFAVMRDGRPMQHAKKAKTGRVARLEVLQTHFPEVEQRVTDRRPIGVGRDDLLDAYVLLWTARRVVDGQALRLPQSGPAEVQRDVRGLRAEMHA